MVKSKPFPVVYVSVLQCCLGWNDIMTRWLRLPSSKQNGGAQFEFWKRISYGLEAFQKLKNGE